MKTKTVSWEAYRQEIKKHLSWRDVFGHLTGVTLVNKDKSRYSAQCPFHADKQNSFGFIGDTLRWKCYAGCGEGSVFDFIAKSESKDYRDALLQLGEKYNIVKPNVENTLENEQNTASKAKSVVAEYVYADEVGQPKYKEVRYEPKTFRQFRYGGNNRWIPGLGGMEPLPYNLPAVIASKEVIVCEGAKDAEALIALGFVATTNNNGANNWPAKISVYFKDKDVIIISDLDRAGDNRNAEVAKALYEFASSIKIIRLPGLDWREKSGLDISDWLQVGGEEHNAQALRQLINSTPALQSIEEAQPEAQGIDRFKLDGKIKHVLIAEALMEQHHFMNLSPLSADARESYRIMRYHNGIYRNDGASTISNEVARMLHTEHSTQRVNQTKSYIAALTQTDPLSIEYDQDLICVENGVLNWVTGELLEHNPKYRFLSKIPVKFNPDIQTCPEIEAFIERIIPADCVDMMYEFIAYCMIPVCDLQQCLICVGSGANGKSTLLNMIQQFIGEDNCSHISLQHLSDDGNRFARAELQNKLINMFPDLPNTKLTDTGFFKALVAGDPLQAERKNEQPFKFKPYAKMIFSANELPHSADKGKAFFRRLLIVPFEKSFEGKDADVNLLSKLTQPRELSGLLYYSIHYLRTLMERGCFEKPESVTNALNAYQEQIDPVVSFLRNGSDYCYLTAEPDNDMNTFTNKSELYKAYKGWCEHCGLHPISAQKFNKKVKEVFPYVREKNGVRIPGHTGTFRAWDGIRLCLQS